jgi:hypothetical protein
MLKQRLPVAIGYSVMLFGLISAATPASNAAASLGIPAYFGPSDTADWNLLQSSASKVSLVIIDPANGPDPAQAAAYKTLYSNLHSHGITVLGYVHTAEGCRPYHQNYPGGDPATSGKGVEGDIQEWAAEGDCDGIFLDETPGAGTWASAITSWSDGVNNYAPGAAPENSLTYGNYFQPLRPYAQSLTWPGGEQPVITVNPGVGTDEQYLYDPAVASTHVGVADIVMDVEEGPSGTTSGYNAYANDAWLTAQFQSGGGLAWVYNHAANHFWQIAWGYDSSASEVDTSFADAANWHAAYVYFTDKNYSSMPGSTVWNENIADSTGQIAPPSGGNNFSNEKAWDDGTNFYYQASFTDAYAHFHVFIDTDGNAATGYTINDTGAEYMIEDTGLYPSTANGASWSWGAKSATVTETVSGNTVTLSMPLSAIGSPQAARVSFAGLDASWNSTTCPAIVFFAHTPPTGLTATAGNAQATLSWTASTGATSYNVYRGTTSGGEAGTPVATGVTTTSYTDTGLTNGVTYYYKVAAVSAGGVSAQSSEANTTPFAPPTFSNEKAWDDGTNFYYEASYTGTYAHFDVMMDTDQNASTGFAVNGIGADYLIEDSGFYKNNGGGWSWTPVSTPVSETFPTSGTVLFSVPLTAFGAPAGAKIALQGTDANWNATLDPTVVSYTALPAAPTGLTAMAGNTQAFLSWTASSGTTSYNVYEGTTAGAESATAIEVGITGTSSTISNLTNGTQYYFVVKAVNAGGVSGPSNEASAVPTLPYTDVTSRTSVLRGCVLPNFAGGGYYQMDAIKNISASSIAGPIEIVITGLPSGVKVTNAAGTLNGNPYLTATTSALAAGSSVSVRINYSNPTNMRFSYGVTVLSGPIN